MYTVVFGAGQGSGDLHYMDLVKRQGTYCKLFGVGAEMH